MKHRSFSRRSFLGALGASAAAAGFRFANAEEKKLNFYNWDTYIGETTLDDFKDATGIAVTMDLYGDNSELFAKMREGNPGYDVIVPSNDFVERMWRAKLIQPLDYSGIPNYAINIDPIFKNADFDPNRKYSVPYMWGTMGIGYRKSKVKRPESWSDVWGPDSDKYAGQIGWISEPSSMIGMTLKYLGYSFNETDPAKIREAADQLIKYKKNVKGIFEDDGQDKLAAGEVDIAVEWNGDIAQLINEDPDIDYVIPKEGSYIWQDCLCVPTGAPHPKNAHAFINFLLDAQIGRDLADYIQYATPNSAARKLMDSVYNDNPAIFPPASVVANLEANLYLGEKHAEIIDSEWTRVLAAS